MITLNMIVKNQSDQLDECLAHIKDHVDQIVVVIDSSSDNVDKLFKIVGKHLTENRDIIIVADWYNSFAEHRNIALLHSTNDWVLSIDADERLEQSTIEMLPYYTNQNEYWAFAFPRKNLVTGVYPDYQIRLFLRYKVTWVHRVHEVLRGIPFDKIFFCNTHIIHKELMHKDTTFEMKEISRRKQLLKLDEEETGMSLGWYKSVSSDGIELALPMWKPIEEVKKELKKKRIIIEED